MKFEHFIIALLVPFGLLLVAGGAAFQHFQYWAMTKPSISYERSVSKSGVAENVRHDQTDSQTTKPAHYQLRLISNRPLPEVETVYVQAIERTVKSPSVQAKKVSVTANSELKTEAKSKTQPSVKVVKTATVLPAVVAEIDQVNDAVPAEKAAVTTLHPKFIQARLAKQSVFDLQPVLAVYPDYLILEFAPSLISEQNVKRALTRVLLSPDPYAEQDLLSLAPLNYNERPAFYRQILDHKQRPIRYPSAGFDYAEFLMTNHQTQIQNPAKEPLRIKIPLYASNLQEPARRYEPWVFQFAKDFNVPPALVFAVMETESRFNPLAVSKSNAKGLMQIKPNAAGRDVYQYIDFKIGAPGDEELFDAQSNIRLGTAYLGLLKHGYLAEIKNADIREMVAISSYNGGMSTVLRLFADTPEQAIKRINRLNKAHVYRTLRYDHHSDETRRYLDKVLQAKARYQALLGEDAHLLARR